MLKRGVVYLRENECPKCRGKLVLVSVEKSITQLNKDGLPIINTNIDDDEIDINLVCKKCGDIYDVEKKGMYFKVKKDLPEINPTLEEFNPFSI